MDEKLILHLKTGAIRHRFLEKEEYEKEKSSIFKGRTSRLVRVRGKYEKEKVYFLSMMLVYLLNVKMVCGDYEKFVNKM